MTGRKVRAAMLAAVAVAVSSPVISSAAIQYQLTVLNPLAGDQQSDAHFVSGGLVVGESDNAGSGIQSAVTYNAVTPTGGAIDARVGYNSVANAVNSAGLIVGTAQPTSSDPSTFAYGDLTGTNAPYLNNTLGATSSTAYGVSNAVHPTVVGRATLPFGVSGLIDRAFYYSNGTMNAIDTAPRNDNNQSQATAVNSSGMIVGWDMEVGAGDRVAFEYDSAAATPTATRILTTGEDSEPGAATSHANAINAAGQVVGDTLMGDGSTTQAFLYQGGGSPADALGFLPLGSQLSVGLGINDSGDLVGNGDNSDPRATGPDEFTHAFISHQGGALQDLNGLIDPSLVWSTSQAGITLLSAESISDSGQIAGLAVLDDNVNPNPNLQFVGFLLTPTTAIPEPATAGLLVIGLGSLLFGRRRHERT